ncbi:MAG TPA: molybdenum cofactor guanylyltransferase [Candidatus Acidoferrales bacterium]|nr:molybdenum cofactor guanylyltransferase [Candidatus Acidoferrales bacterium]
MKRSNFGVAAFVLAGGESSRMGRDKALLEIGGTPMIVRVTRLAESVAGPVRVIGSPQRFEALGLPAIRDDWPGAGPLGAIATALRASECAWNLVVACDLPYLTLEWLAFLIERARTSAGDVVLPMNDAGAEPLCAMYHKNCEPAVWLALDRGVRKVIDGLAHVRVEYMERAEWKRFDSEGLLFKNMNSPDDYERAKARFAKTQKTQKRARTLRMKKG